MYIKLWFHLTLAKFNTGKWLHKTETNNQWKQIRINAKINNLNKKINLNKKSDINQIHQFKFFFFIKNHYFFQP